MVTKMVLTSSRKGLERERERDVDMCSGRRGNENELQGEEAQKEEEEGGGGIAEEENADDR